MIELKNISVTFNENEKDEVDAVKNVNLTIEDGTIFGIVGYSGAGKSTLVRVINLLQRPTKGKILVDGCDLTKLAEKQLRQKRKDIGMIFQHFNLLEARTIGENVAFPLKYQGITKEKQQAKVKELLKLVGLTDKINVYPSQLSGGQKQRVAIARALASDPKILLCDEATSALDPKTTGQILKLLQKLNRKLNLTIILITHEMQVVKEICQKTAVMSNGQIVEKGEVLQVFNEPKTELTKKFIATAFRQEDILHKVIENSSLSPDETLVELSYTGKVTNEPLLADLYQRFEIKANILYGNIEYLQQVPVGKLIVSLVGSKKKISESLAYLNSKGVKVKLLNTSD